MIASEPRAGVDPHDSSAPDRRHDRPPAPAAAPGSSGALARRIVVEGIVQGVGFRPWTYRLAERLGLGGRVRNTSSGVEVEVEGPPDAVARYIDALVASPPSLAHVHRVEVEEAVPRGGGRFEIEPSRDGPGFQPIAPDAGTCPACLREVEDPRDRRFGYPFANCTECGPRFTIIRAIPYDRLNTTMAGFSMCAACRAEYEDPTDRRFHAEPNACPSCGPRLLLTDAQGRSLAGEPLAETRRLLGIGRIVAIKGIGGFHLACDATNEVAVRRLRARKQREAKPLACMVPDLAEAQRCAELSEAERTLLDSRARPIVLLRARPGSGVAPSVAPGTGRLGLVLPYSPLHHLLFRGDAGLRALVLTSGNRSAEPILIEDEDARARLSGIADAFLLHNRPIWVRADDSVTRAAAGREMPLRRGRGYAPYPVRLPLESRPLLACGADLKSTVCLSRGPYAFISPHIGDLENYDTYVAYRRMIAHMADLFRIRPEAVAHDLHPGYVSTGHALSLDAELPRVGVQHHHAHVAACMAEHRLRGKVIGVAFDGTGYGTDGCVWGGEVLVADYAGFRRAAHLGYVPMPGGDRAVREPFRMALAHLRHAYGAWDRELPPVAAASDAERRAVASQLDHGFNAPLTSSVGRLFDAIASLLGVRHRVGYEGQAAIELEALVAPGASGAYPVVLTDEEPAVIDPAPIVRGVVADLEAATPVPVIAARFHTTLVVAISEVAARIRAATGLRRVVLSGGVFQNATLLEGAVGALGAAGFEVFTHRAVPPNDGGIALGQAAVAAARAI